MYEQEDEACAPRADAAAPGAHTCACKHKHTPRSEELQRDVQKRLNRAIGQLGGVKAMIDDNRYCGDVLMQLAAAQSAIRRVSEMLLREHLETCVVEEVRAGNDEVVEEVMDLIRRFS
ncbi:MULTISPECIES: metal-sensing transcriptional repressor [unclassified Adlercreutzia]|uniref:metal-sensing transcriptional repressor n=1 Tax=unclassified Adlercreutzia TaxID=2636013 RepID=UPI0013ED5188|nr:MULTISPECIES: metal-sensing transcriptional repressor [unclassified Adlercreutzia]